jgi:DNA helicase II / ATP-dependent DNA helicase PcrA
MRAATRAEVHPSSRGPPDLLGHLDAEQRSAAMLPDGLALVLAPAGSGKTTTLVARLGVLVARGVQPERIGVVTFNRQAAAELSARIRLRLGSVDGAERIEVRTLHAMARRVLLDTVRAVRLVADRGPLLRAARRQVGGAPTDPDLQQLDGELSAWKVERRTPSAGARPILEVYARLLAERGALDMDDLVSDAVDALEADPHLHALWQARFTHLCVDEFQDVDAAQLRLVHLLAEPERNLWVVGDDDQTIYAWRLADVRRILDFGGDPSVRRVMLATNYRCPSSVVESSARLIAVNGERFAKPIRAAPTAAAGSISAVPTDRPGWADRLAALAAHESAAGRTCCFLGRTRGDVEPMLRALVRADVPHATALRSPLEAEPVGRLVAELARAPPDEHPIRALLRIRDALGWRRDAPGADALSDEDHDALDAAIGWATAVARVDAYLAGAAEARARLARLRRPDALVEVGTVHAAKGREWHTVVLVGFEEDRFPNRRALLGHRDPGRALEEERRLAYVALTRAGERLVLAFDPARPSRFLAEMGYSPTSGATTAR